MAKIHGISGSTQYLLNGTITINGKNLATLEDITHFHKNYDAILAETESNIQQQHDEMIRSLTNDEVRLDRQMHEGITRRAEEVDGNIDEIDTKIESAENVFRWFVYNIQFWIAIALRTRRIQRPLIPIVRELNDVQYRKASLIQNKQYAIKKERENIIHTQKHITENISFLIGAEGEEAVINELSQLPDDYHILNDVNLRFRKAIYWKEKREYIKTCQIDHIVVGPTGIFLVETKNWKTSDIEIKSDKLIWQVRRSNLALWYYLKDYYQRGEIPKIRAVIVSMHGSQSGQRLDQYIDVIAPHRLCGYIARRNSVLSDDAINKLIEVIPCSTSY